MENIISDRSLKVLREAIMKFIKEQFAKQKPKWLLYA